MASSATTTGGGDHDPLLLLRQAISTSSPFLPSASSDPDASEGDENIQDSDSGVPLAQASHLRFPRQSASLALDAPTRFVSNDQPVDLRSIYFAWLNRELAIPEYNAAATALNDRLVAAAAPGRVQNLGFIERLDLITWLEGASEESEYIKPLAGDAAAAAAAAAAAGTSAALAPEAKTGSGAAGAGAAAALAKARSGKGTLDPRLASVYDAERRMGDHKTALRGIKPTDFSHVRKLAAPFLLKKPLSISSGATAAATTAATTAVANSTASTTTTSTAGKRGRRPDPIILLSPSASSLLRMSNARSFLEDGHFVPPDGAAQAGNMLHVQRAMRTIDPSRPVRFILVEGPEQFKPEYWNRIVAVFTTGQNWQFKNYKWSNPNELFKRVLGVYVGWRGDQPPDNVRGWGHRVLATAVDRWRGSAAGGGGGPGGVAVDASRFRDKEVVEHIWKAIEMNMRSKGWSAHTSPDAL